MRDFLKSFSINTLAFALIFAGLIVILVSNPPRSICDAELDNFREGMAGVLSSKGNRPASLPIDRDNCRDQNSPGACLAFFSGLKKFLDVSGVVSEKCQEKLGEAQDFQNVLVKSVDLMVNLAWGAKAAPASPSLKNGWFNASDVYLYCRLRNRLTQVYGDKRWESYREKFFTDLPGAKALTRQQVWEKSLLSTNCNSL